MNRLEHRRLRAASSRRRRRRGVLGGEGNRRSLRRDEGGFFMAFFTVILIAVGILIAGLLPWIGTQLAQGIEIGTLNVHVPLFVNANDPLMVSTSTLTTWGGIETTMGKLYGTFQSAGLVAMAVVLILAGLYFTLEPIGLVREGTAFGILSGSLVTLLLLALFPVFYNAAASTLNYFNEGVVLSGNVTGISNRVAEAACSPTIPGLEGIADVIARFIFGAMSIMVVFGAGVVGVMRILMIGIFATVFPLFIVLRLIPFLRSASDTIVSTVIGVMLGSILAATFFRFGYDVLVTLSGTGYWIAGVGVLSSMSMLPSLLAPSIGRMLMRAGAMTTAAVGSAVAGVTAMAGGVAGAGLTGGAGGLTHVTGLAAGSSGWQQAVARIKNAGRGFGSGAVAGVGKPGAAGVFAGYGAGHHAVDTHVTGKVIPKEYGMGQAENEMAAINSRFDNHRMSLGGKIGTVKGIEGLRTKAPDVYQANVAEGRYKLTADGGVLLKNLVDPKKIANMRNVVHFGRNLPEPGRIRHRGEAKHVVKAMEASKVDKEFTGTLSDRLVDMKANGRDDDMYAFYNIMSQGGKPTKTPVPERVTKA